MRSTIVTRIVIHRDGGPIFFSSDVDEIAQRLAQFGVDNPHPLVDAALQFGEVDIHEGSKSDE